jgi:hypothetical protein
VSCGDCHAYHGGTTVARCTHDVTWPACLLGAAIAATSAPYREVYDRVYLRLQGCVVAMTDMQEVRAVT